MKILGLIGGISWVSTIDYYRLINQGVNEKLGDLNFAECIIHSFNYADIKRNNDAEDWDTTLSMLTAAGQNLKNSGAKGDCALRQYHAYGCRSAGAKFTATRNPYCYGYRKYY